MTLYNFFTEVTGDEEKIEDMHYCMILLNEMNPKPNFVKLVKRQRKIHDKDSYSIIGQVLGEDTNVGDTQLLCIFSTLKYTIFDAYFPEDCTTFNQGEIIRK